MSSPSAFPSAFAITFVVSAVMISAAAAIVVAIVYGRRAGKRTAARSAALATDAHRRGWQFAAQAPQMESRVGDTAPFGFGSPRRFSNFLGFTYAGQIGHSFDVEYDATVNKTIRVHDVINPLAWLLNECSRYIPAVVWEN